MATILTNNFEIPAPTPPQLRYGLLTAAASRQTLDIRGVSSGIQFPAEDCGLQVATYNATCDTPHATKTFVEGTPFFQADPYWLIATYKCGTVGTTSADVQRRVRRKYDAGIQQRLEQMVWDGGGLAGVTPTLTGTAGTVTVVPTANGAGAAIAALEQAFYDLHGYVGTIHMNQVAYAAVQYADLLETQTAGVWRTPLGSKWSLGSGYGITGPANVAPAAGFVWAFMTPDVHLWESEVSTPDPLQVLERPTNQWHGIAESVWAHAWLCDTVAAVQVPIAAPAVATAPAAV